MAYCLHASDSGKDNFPSPGITSEIGPRQLDGVAKKWVQDSPTEPQSGVFSASS